MSCCLLIFSLSRYLAQRHSSFTDIVSTGAVASLATVVIPKLFWGLRGAETPMPTPRVSRHLSRAGTDNRTENGTGEQQGALLNAAPAPKAALGGRAASVSVGEAALALATQKKPRHFSQIDTSSGPRQNDGAASVALALDAGTPNQMLSKKSNQCTTNATSSTRPCSKRSCAHKNLMHHASSADFERQGMAVEKAIATESCSVRVAKKLFDKNLTDDGEQRVSDQSAQQAHVASHSLAVDAPAPATETKQAADGNAHSSNNAASAVGCNVAAAVATGTKNGRQDATVEKSIATEPCSVRVANKENENVTDDDKSRMSDQSAHVSHNLAVDAPAPARETKQAADGNAHNAASAVGSNVAAVVATSTENERQGMAVEKAIATESCSVRVAKKLFDKNLTDDGEQRVSDQSAQQAHVASHSLAVDAPAPATETKQAADGNAHSSNNAASAVGSNVAAVVATSTENGRQGVTVEKAIATVPCNVQADDTEQRVSDQSAYRSHVDSQDPAVDAPATETKQAADGNAHSSNNAASAVGSNVSAVVATSTENGGQTVEKAIATVPCNVPADDTEQRVSNQSAHPSHVDSQNLAVDAPATETKQPPLRGADSNTAN